jgi:hypothetical protein
VKMQALHLVLLHRREGYDQAVVAAATVAWKDVLRPMEAAAPQEKQ